MAWIRYVRLALLFFPLVAQSQASQSLWEVNLSQYGYQGRPPAALAHLPPSRSPLAAWAYQQGVAFTDQDIVVGYFVVHDDSPAKATERSEPSISDPFRLIAIFLNADNGALIRKLDWPLPVDPNAVSPSFFFPATKGRFLVALGDTLSLYSSDFKILAHIDAQSDFEPVASPSGESILLNTGSEVNGHWIPQYQLVDTKTLSTINSSAEPSSHLPHSIEAVWNDELAWTEPNSLFFSTPVSKPKELLAERGGFCGAWAFVGKGVLAGPVCGGANKLVTISTEGSLVWDYDLGFEQVDGPVATSSNGQRFAASTFRWGSGRNNAPDKLTARVFGIRSSVPLLTLNVPRNFGEGQNYFYGSYGDTRFGWGGLALSPSGELLAVKSGASIQMYRVPAAGSAMTCEPNCGNQLIGKSSQQPSPQADSRVAAALPGPSSHLIKQMLSWFPADTETVTAVTGPVPLPELEKESDGTFTMAGSGHEVRDKFMQFPLMLLLDLGKSLQGTSILTAMEGSRDFQPPGGLGMMKYQGGVIAVFAGDIKDRAGSYLKDSKSGIVRTEQIAGHTVAVFKGKSEEDLWTTYVTFPRPNIAVAADNEAYFREILARIDGKQAERALPDTLPEWKHVNTHAQFWAVRHYQKAGAQTDPTSPFGRGFGNTTDPQAIGLTFSFDPDKSKTATITYLSGDENSLPRFKKEYFTEPGPEVTQMHIRYREVEPGVLEGAYDVDQIELADYFLFVLQALLGHAIYV